MEPLQISAKHLGALALNNCCERCYWIRLKLRNKFPFQVFPSIFSKIDGYTKLLVHGYFDQFNGPPTWLDDIGMLTGYVEPPTFQTFRIHDPASNVTLTGSPDAIFKELDGSYVIGDYKTASPEADSLLMLTRSSSAPIAT